MFRSFVVPFSTYCSLFADILLHFSGRPMGVWILVGFTVFVHACIRAVCNAD